MSQSVDGPMSLLRSFHARHLRVFISIRASHTLRSILSGFLVAFDKHWNLVLNEIDEEYTEWEWHKYGRQTIDKLRAQGARWRIPKASRKAIARLHQPPADGGAHAMELAGVAGASSSSSSSFMAPLIQVEVFKRRHLHQLYIRGDSVVSVTQHKPTLLRPPMEEGDTAGTTAGTSATG